MKLRTKGLGGPLKVDLPDGAWIEFRPWASAALAAGHAAYAAALAIGGSPADANVAFTAGAAGWGAVAWGGILDDETDEPLELSPALVQQLVTQDPDAFLEIDRRYVVPGLDREREKNGSSPSLAGAMPAGAKTEA